MKTADIAYRDGALTCRGFLAYDETKTGRRPGVLVVHEAFGLGKHAMDRAKMLAGLGYVAFAADMFGDRMQVTELPKAIEIITDLLGNPPKLLARADAALEVLRQRPEVDAARLGGIGFCFGGSTVLQLARSGADLKLPRRALDQGAGQGGKRQGGDPLLHRGGRSDDPGRSSRRLRGGDARCQGRLAGPSIWQHPAQLHQSRGRRLAQPGDPL